MKTIFKSLLLAALLSASEGRSAPFGVKNQVASLKESKLSHGSAADITRQPSWQTIPRGGDSVVSMASDAISGLQKYMGGAKSDTLLLLLTTALNTPICQALKTSPILGFLALGVLFGPNGFSLINDVHKTEMMADLGIVFFLFEMGIHLDFKTLMDMRKDVFGLGGSQFIFTAIAIAFIAKICGLSSAAQIVIGGGLALSSSAFVLQLLKDKNQLETTFGKKSFGVLLLQDLAVVPLLVVTPILAGSGSGLGSALASAGLKAAMALSTIAVAGKFLLKPFFKAVVETKSQEALVGAILFTVLGMSFLTEGLGLSNTLGAFLAGILLSETEYKHEIEKEIAVFRGILVGLFFFTVGFEIDLQLIGNKAGLVASIVAGIIALKALIAASAAMAFGLDKSIAQQVGLIVSQGGEFAFVAFRLARSHGILDNELTKLLLTCVSLTMGVTPFLEELGTKMAAKLAPAPAPVKSIKSKKR